MTLEEYFGDWAKVIDKEETFGIMRWLNTIDKDNLCPAPKNIFKAFQLCPLKDCKAVILSQDPYPQKGIATGIAFGNSPETSEELLSPSLKVIKEAMIDYEIPHNRIEFDNSLEFLAKQGVLMLNSALTCEVGKVGIHFNIWRPFIEKLLYNLSIYDPGLVYVLFGNQAMSFEPHIHSYSEIIHECHLAYFARKGTKMPKSVFQSLQWCVKQSYGYDLKYYKESEYGTC